MVIERFTVEVVVEYPEGGGASSDYIRRRLPGALQYLDEKASAALLIRDGVDGRVVGQTIKNTPSDAMRDTIDGILDEAG